MPDAADSARTNSSKTCSGSAGSRSTSRASEAGDGWPLTARLTSSGAGPVSPKWAKSIDPRRVVSALPLSATRRLTSGIVMPRRSATQSAATVSGTSAGRVGTMVCPKFVAKVYPSPVVPQPG